MIKNNFFTNLKIISLVVVLFVLGYYLAYPMVKVFLHKEDSQVNEINLDKNFFDRLKRLKGEKIDIDKSMIDQNENKTEGN